jgi:hypothetical protein
MSLIAFHKFLITTAILFSLGLAARQGSEFQKTEDVVHLITAVVFAALALGLGVYLRRLRHFLKLPEPGPFTLSQTDYLDGPDASMNESTNGSKNGSKHESV